MSEGIGEVRVRGGEGVGKWIRLQQEGGGEEIIPRLD
jgi:hypothetical protein